MLVRVRPLLKEEQLQRADHFHVDAGSKAITVLQENASRTGMDLATYYYDGVLPVATTQQAVYEGKCAALPLPRFLCVPPRGLAVTRSYLSHLTQQRKARGGGAMY